MILEPDKFPTEYHMAGQCEALTGKKARCSKGGSACIEGLYGPEWFCSTHAPENCIPSQKQVLKPKEWDLCGRLRDAVRSHPAAKKLVASASEKTVEICIVWKCKVTGVLNKARIDLAVFEQDLNFIADLKSCEDASEKGFVKSIFKYGYALQAAHYMDGCETLGFAFPGYVIIAFEKQRPHNVACYWLDQQMINLGKSQVLRLRQQYKNCLELEYWPGYSEEVVKIAFEPYMERAIEDS
jgi:hypothetical protein